MQRKHVIVIGGSVAGLATALALSRRGHHVTVLEADAAPHPSSPADAFAWWKRQGTPQLRHSHALLARVRNLLRDHEPTLLDRLEQHGAQQVYFADRLCELFADPTPADGDEDIVWIACRRTTFEWVLREHVLATGRVELCLGVQVVGLEAPRNGWIPRVTGVRVRGADGYEVRMQADLVVDASGRRSKLGTWLREIGTPEVREESSPCGIFYATRFYRLRDGVAPPRLDGGVIGADLGYLKVGLFAGDSGTFSITLAASPQDEPLRSVLRAPGFDTAVAAVPLAAEWASSDRSTPISDVHSMSNLRNMRRFMVEDGSPLALGFVAVGDALLHTNPISGRGCSFAWAAAYHLADCLDAHGDDLLDLALAYEARIESDLVPWYRLQLSQDADAIDLADAQRRGEDPFCELKPDGTPNPAGFMRALRRDGLGPALERDPMVLRSFARAVHLLDPPAHLLLDADIQERILEIYESRHARPAPPAQGPERSEMLELLARAELSSGVPPVRVRERVAC